MGQGFLGLKYVFSGFLKNKYTKALCYAGFSVRKPYKDAVKLILEYILFIKKIKKCGFNTIR